MLYGRGRKREEKEERDDSQTFQGVIRVIHDGYSHSEKCMLNLTTVPMMCGFLLLQHHGILKFLLCLIHWLIRSEFSWS